MKHLITAEVLGQTSQIQKDYVSARPFKHACIEGFLDPRWAETLLEEFPVFDPAKAVNEFGKVGRKAVRTDLREISDHYREFYDYISSQPFLDAMSAMTGIPDLRFDTQMYGGGTHENLEGQALDAHVDFNYDQERKLHRRINLLVYLNKEWDVSWGGAIQLHSDPRDWEHDEVKTFNCSFNRCVVFETNEHSWHGFRRISLPEGKHGLTRKCISIYLYTLERPAEEIVPLHGTFYVQEPLPPEYAAGRRLDMDDLVRLRAMASMRDDWIGLYQRQQADFLRENAGLRIYAASLRRNIGFENMLSTLAVPSRLRGPLRSWAARLRGLLRGPASPAPATKEAAAPAAAPASPLPPTFIPGYTLREEDVQALKTLLRERDARIKRYQQMELDRRRETDDLHVSIKTLLSSIRLPVEGPLRQRPGSVYGAYADGWVASDIGAAFVPKAPISGVAFGIWTPSTHPAGMSIEAFVDGASVGSLTPVAGKSQDWQISLPIAQGREFSLALKTTRSVGMPTSGTDQRDTAFVLKKIVALR